MISRGNRKFPRPAIRGQRSETRGRRREERSFTCAVESSPSGRCTPWKLIQQVVLPLTGVPAPPTPRRPIRVCIDPVPSRAVRVPTHPRRTRAMNVSQATSPATAKGPRPTSPADTTYCISRDTPPLTTGRRQACFFNRPRTTDYPQRNPGPWPRTPDPSFSADRCGQMCPSGT